MKNILVILGTRPEAIKLAPVILELRKYPDNFKVFICNTEQQKELSNQTLSYFGLNADFNLDVMKPNQTLAGVQSIILSKLSEVYQQQNFDATIVQGDTMTVLCGALSSFYNQIPVFHVEAGLRSYNLFEPFPEEAIRQMTARITDLHFAPTAKSAEFLSKENISTDKIKMTGNTVIDALSCISKNTLEDSINKLEEKNIILNDKLVLVTAHRRENHGERLDDILNAISTLANKYKDHQFVIPVHPNPNVKDKVFKKLKDLTNIVLSEPLAYPQLVCLMEKSKLILTDSGGIQEEGPSFGSPVLVMRYETERQEGVDAGVAKLVGADFNKIVNEASKILDLDRVESRLDGSQNPYGDGKAAKNIIAEINNFFNV